MKFKKITVDCNPDCSDTVAYTLHELGSMGEVFDDYNNIRQVLDDKRWDYADAALFTPTSGCYVSGFFPYETDETILAAQILKLKNCGYGDFSQLDVATEIIDSEEWENEWKKYYQPFRIGKLMIIPEWIDYKPCGELPVYLNPGLAFGTGMHETTSMCVELMQRLDVENKRVLDFGCGSGILGICAHALGARSVLFADTDEQAVSATKYNCALNKIKSPEILQCDVRELKEPADIVIANITADVLVSVEPIIKSAVGRGGYAVISGIISDKAEIVKSAYSKSFTLVAAEQKNEWSAFVFKL